MPSSKQTPERLEKTVDVVARHKHVLWARFALRASVISIAIAAGALFFRGLDLAPDMSYLDVSVLSGSPEGHYHSVVERLARTAADEQGTVRNISTRGSRENLERLAGAKQDCDVQLGLVQDGFDQATYQGLELIGRVGRSEAILLLGRDGDAIQRLAELNGLRIGIGPERSGSAFLAERLFSAPDLASLKITLEHYPLKRQTELAAAGELDLAFFVMDEDADLLRRAIRDLGLQIVGFEHTEALARRIPFADFGSLPAGQFDPVRVLPPVAKPILRLDTLLLSNGCAGHSDIVALMTELARAYPNFIERNKTSRVPPGLTLSESARGFYENQGAALTDEYVPWLVDIMPPSNWVYTIMAVSLFFNLAGSLNNQRLALIDLNRVALENDIALLFGTTVSNDEIRQFDPRRAGRQIDPQKLNRLIEAYKRHLNKARRQSLSVLSPMGEEMGYRDQEIIMTATLDALRELRQRLDREA